jgi:hypothetical protein
MLKGQLFELEEIRRAVIANAKQFQSYPVAREAMTKLVNKISQRIIDHTATLKELETNVNASR